MFCTYCGKRVDVEFEFCPFCGRERVKLEHHRINSDDIKESMNSTENLNKHLLKLKNINGVFLFTIYFIIYFFLAYLLSVVSSVAIVVIAIIISILLNGYIIVRYGNKFKLISQISALVFLSSFISIYINYQYTAGEYIDKIYLNNGIFVECIFLSLFVTVVNFILYYVAIFAIKDIRKA